MKNDGQIKTKSDKVLSHILICLFFLNVFL